MISRPFDYVSSFLSSSGQDTVRPVSASEADILSNNRRRVVLKILNHTDEIHFDLGDLSTMLAEWEFGRDYSSSDRHTVYTSLNSTHLPRLDEAGLLEYDRNGRKEVCQTDSIGQINNYLERYPAKDSLFPNAQEAHLETDKEDLLTADEGFHILSNDRRRFVLNHMNTMDESKFNVSELYKNLAAHEMDTDLDDLEASDWTKYNISLRQEHIPVLDELNVVDFDKNENTVTPEPYFGPMTKYIL